MTHYKIFLQYTLILIVISLFLARCARRDQVRLSEEIILTSEQPAGCTYYTEDHRGNPVLCWTSGREGDEKLYYATYHKQLGKFEEAISVMPSKGTGLHAESMNKIAFKGDGSIIAVYGRKHPTEKNKYAGSIVYSQSFDEGKSWTAERSLHTDTLPDNSRSFFDIATLPGGEIGAVWLDGRLKSSQGTSLFFSKTSGKNGFTTDKQIGESVCECCRTDIHADVKGNIHVLYRDIESSVQGQVRDFVHIFSLDSGKTFSSLKKISEDNWVIDGCPHTGATMSTMPDQLACVWFTAGGRPGLYLTQSHDEGNTFFPRQLISEEARHPQLAHYDNTLMVVWDEPKPIQHVHSEQKPDHHHRNSSGKIIFALLDKSGSVITQTVVDEEGEFPVVWATKKEALVAYTRSKQVVVRRVALEFRE